jgi:hypothetical protein
MQRADRCSSDRIDWWQPDDFRALITETIPVDSFEPG